jgi:hypothetical protein
MLFTNFTVTFRFKPDWEKAGEVPGDKLEGKVIDLKERGEYQFRIVAVNKAGLSPPSEPTQMHLVKHKLRKNFIRLFHSTPNILLVIITPLFRNQ